MQTVNYSRISSLLENSFELKQKKIPLIVQKIKRNDISICISANTKTAVSGIADEKESERMYRGTDRIARSAKKGNRRRGWRPTATGRGATGNFETRNSELDNTNGTINVTFRNDVRRQLRGDIYRCFPPEVIIVCRVSPGTRRLGEQRCI